MLRLPRFELRQPTSVAEAAGLLADLGSKAVVLAGGTDLLPNMKHELFTPAVVVSLGRIEALRGIRVDADGSMVIGSMTTIADVAQSQVVAERAPCLSQAASLIAGPQLRRAGTIGGNVLLDTRCQYYNQSHFWRTALGFCLKKDGTACHVVAGGSRCVAASAADTAPALMTLGATLELERAGAQRAVALEDFWVSDGLVNRRMLPGEILVSIRIPPTPPGHRGAYGKLRERGSIDFPLLGVAVRLDLDTSGLIERAELVLTALAARPRRLSEVASLLGVRPGTHEFDRTVKEVAETASRRCRTLSNLSGDTAWRQDMIPVYVRRTLHAAIAGSGPVHHL
ncbi:MAG: FAD binding domain-containing protein [Vicinamibacteria bacterium]|nr:FAD binding domain-containing protein [Vicinamibacteria bacterium]